MPDFATVLLVFNIAIVLSIPILGDNPGGHLQRR